jgi:hypothetical protein
MIASQFVHPLTFFGFRISKEERKELDLHNSTTFFEFAEASKYSNPI